MEIKQEKGLISLKEASSLSGYSSDYIGQLIRVGKIPGKQVCCNVAWMTTADAVMAYKNKGNAQAKLSLSEKLANRIRMIQMEFDIVRLFFKTFKYSLPLLLVIIIIFSLFSFYAINLISGTKADNQLNSRINQPSEQNLAF